MNINRSALAALLTSYFVYPCAAEDRANTQSTVERHSIVQEKSGEALDLAVTRIAKMTGHAAANAVTSEVFQNVTIAAGQTVSIDSTMDYGSASTVAVTVLCVICSTPTTSLGSTGLVLQARWTVPNAASYVAAENKAATAFPYSDAGGALFNVYGTQFRLVLQNKGAQPIAVQQVTIFLRGPS